ncbi:unnamed protein product [Closterium sp. NIES-54]
MDAEMASWKSTGTYVDEVPPPRANIVSGMWIFRVKWPPGSPPVFKARYVARGFSQRQGVHFFHTFSPTPKMTTLRVLLHVAAQRDYELHSLDFSTAFLQGSLHEEIWLRRPPGFTGLFPPGTQWSLRRPVYGLRQAPREWHDTLRTTLAALGFAPSTADPSLFLRTDATLPPFYVLVYVDDIVFATTDTEALAHVKSELQKRHTCTDLGELRSYLGLQNTRNRAQRTITLTHTSGMGLVLGRRARVVLTCHADASWADDLTTQRSSQGYTFSLGSGSISWRSTRSSSVLSSSCEAEIYAGAMAAQELRWLTYLLTDLGEAPHSPPVLYVDNKAMLALCQEHRLEHRTKHIALRYFLARELQQRGQLRLAYVASQANTADVFTKALQPCDHQHFCTVLGLVVFTALFAFLYITLHVNWPSGPLPVLRVCGDFVIHPEFALSFLTSLVTPCSPPLCLWGDHFLSLDPTSLTVDLLEQHLLAAETSAVAVGAARGTPRYPSIGLDLVGVAAVEAVGLVAVGLDLVVASGSNRSVGARPSRPSSSVSGCFSVGRLGVVIAAHMSGVAIFNLDLDVILSAVYALSASAEGDCYRCNPPDPGIAAAASGACESGTLPGTAPSEALHTFTLDSGASQCFFRDSTTLTPLPAPVPVRMADPSGGPVVAHSSTVLPCPTVPSRSRVSICTCTWTGHHLATFTRWPGSSLYTLATEPPQVAASCQVAASGQVAASCSCRLLSHQTLMWHRRLGHPSLPRLRGMHSHLLVSNLPRSVPPLSPCLPCVKGRQRAAPHSSSFPPTSAPRQTLYMDVGGEFSSDLLQELCRGEGILQSITLLASPQQNGIVEHRIGLVMEPHVSLPETLPTLRWTGEVGDASVFRVWGSRAFVCDMSADKLSARAIPCGPAPSGVSQVDPLPGTVPFEVAVGSGAAQGAESGGAACGGAEPRGAEFEGAGSGGAEPGGEEPGGAESAGVEPGGAEPGGAEPRGAASSGGPAGALLRLSLQQLREWLVRRARLRSGATRAGGAGVGGARVTAGAGGTGGYVALGLGGASSRGAGAAGSGGVGGAGAEGVGVGGTCAGGTGAAGAGAVDAGAGGYWCPVFANFTPPLLCPPPDQSQPPLLSAFPVPAPSPYTEQTGGLTERPRPPPVPRTYAMELRLSSLPLRVPLPAPPKSSLPEVHDPESDRAHAASPTVSRLLANAVTDPSFESTAASALVAELLDFAAACRLDYATAPVAEPASTSPPSVGGEFALSTDILDDRLEELECLASALPHFASMLLAPVGDPYAPDILTPRSYVEVITGPYSSQWQAAMDAKMASWKSTGTYVDEVPPPGANIGVDYFQTFSPTPKMTNLWVLLHVAAQRVYELHSLDFSTAFLQGSLHEEIWLRRPPGLSGPFPVGTKRSLRRPVDGLRQAPREWHNTLRTTLAPLGFAPSTADPSLFLCTDTLLPPFYILVYVDDLAFATADTEALTLVNSELQKRHTCIDLGELCSYLGLQITQDRAWRTITLTQSHMVHQGLQRFGFQFSSPQPTPLSTGHLLSAPPSDESVEPSGPYPELVDCLMYLMTCTRPDFAYPLSLLARYVAPGRHQKVHWDAAKRV